MLTRRGKIFLLVTLILMVLLASQVFISSKLDISAITQFVSVAYYP